MQPYFPTADEIRAGVRWLRRHPVASFLAATVAAYTAFSYLTADRDKSPREEQDGNDRPTAIVTGDASQCEEVDDDGHSDGASRHRRCVCWVDQKTTSPLHHVMGDGSNRSLPKLHAAADGGSSVGPHVKHRDSPYVSMDDAAGTADSPLLAEDALLLEKPTLAASRSGSQATVSTAAGGGGPPPVGGAEELDPHVIAGAAIEIVRCRCFGRSRAFSLCVPTVHLDGLRRGGLMVVVLGGDVAHEGCPRNLNLDVHRCFARAAVLSCNHRDPVP